MGNENNLPPYGDCVVASSESAKESSRRWYAKNRERQLEIRREYYKKTKEESARRKRDWIAKNKERYAEWRRENDKPSPEYQALWQKRNRAHLNEMARANYHSDHKKKIENVLKAARRRAARCSWADDEKIKAMYAEARRMTIKTGVRYEVDHIIPIKHELVCGLHNEFNLQILTGSENARKKNKFKMGIV